MQITNFNVPDGAYNADYSNIIVEGHTADGNYLKECYDRCKIADDAAEVLIPEIGTDFESVMNKTDATFYTAAYFDGTTKELNLLFVVESEDLGWFDRVVPITDDERMELSKVPEVRELFSRELTELAEDTEDRRRVSMTIGNTEVVVFPERTNGGENPDLYQVTVKEADTGNWILDTGDIHIDDLEQVIMNFAEFGNDIKNLEGTTAENYLNETAKDNDKELE